MKIYVFSNKYRAPAAVLCLFLGALFALAAYLDFPRDQSAFAGSGPKPIYSVDTDRKVFSITLNAAEKSEDIEGILDALDEAGVRATFFALGTWADRFPDEMKMISARGHAVENHSDKHPHMNSMSAAEIRADIGSASRKIKEVTGIAPTLFRAPYGEYNDLVVNTAREMGYEVIQWSVDSIDWKGEGEDATVRRVLGGLHPGGIALLHTNAKGVVPALRRILAGAKERGYELVPLNELLLPEPYTVDQLGIQRAVK